MDKADRTELYNVSTVALVCSTEEEEARRAAKADSASEREEAECGAEARMEVRSARVAGPALRRDLASADDAVR